MRAVHLELVDALSTYDTVLAFRRLVARRGLPKVIYSDNAKGFVAAPDKILGQFGPLMNRSDNVSSDTAEMTENRVEIEPEQEVYRTRFGRAVKPVVRFDI